MNAASFPRRQRNRRLAKGARCTFFALLALLFAAAAADVGLSAIALALVAAGVVFGVRARQSLRLARRSDIGARSEAHVRTQLKLLEHEGWRIEHSLRWQGGGDIDHFAVAPPAAAAAFAIETKTRSYGPHDLARIGAIAQWLARRRTGRSRHGAIPVLCLAGSHSIERWEAGVAVVSADRLVSVLRRLAGTTPKPRFLR